MRGRGALYLGGIDGNERGRSAALPSKGSNLSLHAGWKTVLPHLCIAMRGMDRTRWGGRTRTCDKPINSRPLCQLSYTPSKEAGMLLDSPELLPRLFHLGVVSPRAFGGGLLSVVPVTNATQVL